MSRRRRYVRALGALYMRMVGKAHDVYAFPNFITIFCIELLDDLSYQYLEPLLADYRKLRKVIKLQYLKPLSILTLF